MIKQHNTLSTDTEQVFGYSEKNIRLWFVGFVVVLFAFAVGAYSTEKDTHGHDHDDTVAASEDVQTTNVVCPVMTSNEVDPDIFTDYEGKRVYFCCFNCKAAFEKDPQKYLALLPQFGGIEAATDHDHGTHSSGLMLARLIKPVGVATLSCLVLTVAAALLRRKKPRFLLKWHKHLGITTLVLAIVHFILVLIAH
jgi:YHS domain-containing protein